MSYMTEADSHRRCDKEASMGNLHRSHKHLSHQTALCGVDHRLKLAVNTELRE